jgi:hypothetical protein
MKIRNVWFDFTSILLALFMLGCAAEAVGDYFRSKENTILSIVLGATLYLLLSLFFFRMSLVLGKFQEIAKQRKRIFDNDDADIGRDKS